MLKATQRSNVYLEGGGSLLSRHAKQKKTRTSGYLGTAPAPSPLEEEEEVVESLLSPPRSDWVSRTSEGEASPPPSPTAPASSRRGSTPPPPPPLSEETLLFGKPVYLGIMDLTREKEGESADR